jgi:hypothetical protein
MKNLFIILNILVIVFIFGCEREIDNNSPNYSLPDGNPTPTDLEILMHSASITLSWTVSTPSEVVRYRIYVATDEPITYVVHDSTSQTSITIDDLSNNRNYFIKVAAILQSGLEGNRSEYILVRPGLTTFLINQGDEYTSSRQVSLSFTANGMVTHMLVSEDPTLSDAILEQWSSSKSFTLSERDGLKTVYAEFKYAESSTSGELLTAQITYDTQAEINSVSFQPTGTTFNEGDTITFAMDAEPDGTAWISFTGEARVDLFDDGLDGDSTADDGVYTFRYVVPQNPTSVNSPITGHFTDGAGNTAPTLNSDNNLNIN